MGLRGQGADCARKGNGSCLVCACPFAAPFELHTGSDDAVSETAVFFILLVEQVFLEGEELEEFAERATLCC